MTFYDHQSFFFITSLMLDDQLSELKRFIQCIDIPKRQLTLIYIL